MADEQRVDLVELLQLRLEASELQNRELILQMAKKELDDRRRDHQQKMVRFRARHGLRAKDVIEVDGRIRREGSEASEAESS